MPTVSFHQERVVENVRISQTILSVAIQNRIPHLHQCGGHAQCTTCRVRILEGVANCSPRNAAEKQIAQTKGWDQYIRLACQCRVNGDMVVERLVKDSQEGAFLSFQEAGMVSGLAERQSSLAVLFADIRDFTYSSERLTPHDLAGALNKYFSATAQALLNNNAFIDKYMGDGTLAVFGVLGESPAVTCRNAVRAALGMLAVVDTISPEILEEYGLQTRICIGLHYGPVVLGEFGHPGKRALSVIGNTVNIAGRIEGLTKEVDAALLVSDEVVSHLPGELKLSPPHYLNVKGIAEALCVYACEGFEEPEPVFLVQNSFLKVIPYSARFGYLFYRNLFAAHPELRVLFKGDMREQIRMLMTVLTNSVQSLNRLDKIVMELKALGRRHVAYGVTPAHYQALGPVLLQTLEEFLPAEDFTPEAREAWSGIYQVLAAAMLDTSDSSDAGEGGDAD